LAGCGSIDENILVDGNSQPLDTLLNPEICERLHASLNQLPRELQRVLRWRFRKGMTYKQIGERLDRTEDDARMLVNRCLARVRSEVFPKGLNV
jgi:RNA polymerase sigma factor (sigma-70 family)